MNIFYRDGKRVKVMEEINDPKYGKILVVYVDHEKAYIVNDIIVTGGEIFWDLEDRYGIPLSERGILY